MSKVKHRLMGAIHFETAEEVDAACQELKGKGVEFVSKPTDWPWNARAACFVDPEVGLWEIYAWLG